MMSVADLRRRPLLSLLSGPAAGVAAALMYLRVSEGIFLEVGGTSTDITAIQHGQALVRTAEVGGHRLLLEHPRREDHRRRRRFHAAGQGAQHCGVGPRSAHLAKLQYSTFRRLEELEGAKAVTVSPLEGDPAD